MLKTAYMLGFDAALVEENLNRDAFLKLAEILLEKDAGFMSWLGKLFQKAPVKKGGFKAFQQRAATKAQLAKKDVTQTGAFRRRTEGVTSGGRRLRPDFA